MDIPSIIVMLGNLGRSLGAMEHLVAGFAYIIGIFLMVEGLFKFKIAAESPNNQQGYWKPLLYMLMGSALIFLPSSITVLSNSTFGYSNVLQYTPISNPYDIYQTIYLLLQFAGLVWFVRGCVLLVSSGTQENNFGYKGLAFIVAGVLAMNFVVTMGAVNYILNQILHFTITVKTLTGF